MAAVTCQVGLGPKRRLQGTLFNSFTPITVHILSAIAVKPQTRMVVTDGSGCWVQPPCAVLPRPSLIAPCPRLRAPQSSEAWVGSTLVLPWLPAQPCPQKLLQRRRTDRTSRDFAVLTLDTKVWTPAKHSPPRASLYSSHMERVSWADTCMWPSVNPELLDSRNGIIITAQSSHTVLDTELAEEMFVGYRK